MTSFQPPYLAEEVVLLPQHLYLGLLHGDDLLLGQAPRPRPAPLLVGEGDRFIRFIDPVFCRVRDGGFPEHVDRESVRLEDLVPRSPFGMLVDELLHELFGEGYVLGRD